MVKKTILFSFPATFQTQNLNKILIKQTKVSTSKSNFEVSYSNKRRERKNDNEQEPQTFHPTTVPTIKCSISCTCGSSLRVREAQTFKVNKKKTAQNMAKDTVISSVFCVSNKLFSA